MSKLEMTLRTRFGTSAMFRSAKKVSKHTLKMSCMFPPSQSRMFILDSHEMKSAMFAKSTKADSDIELWYKRIGHINLNKLKAMKSKGVIIIIPRFKEKEIEGVCSMPVPQGTPTSIPERAEHEKRTTRRSSFGCMGTVADGYIRWMPILRALYSRLL